MPSPEPKFLPVPAAAPRWVRRILAFATLTLLVGLVSACGRKAASTPRIYGGQAVAPGDLPAVVALTWQTDPNTPPYISCSGALIAPQLVLTAGHCLQGPGIDVAQLGNAVATHLGVYFGSGSEGGTLAPTVGVQRAAYDPMLRAHPLGYADFGLVVLAAPSPVPPLPLRTDIVAQLASLRAGVVTLAGYGEREDRGVGRKFQVSAALTSFNSDEAQVGGQGKDACNGDSGGPALVADSDGGFAVLGSVSRGTTPNCGGGGTIALTADGLCWLAATAGPLWPGPPPDCRTIAAAPDAPPPAPATLCAGASATGQETLRAITASLSAPSCAAAVTQLATMHELNLDYLQLRDLRPLAAFPQLTRLSLRGNRISDLTPLRSLAALRQLDITANAIHELDILADLEAHGLRILGKSRQLWNYTQTPFLRFCQTQTQAAAPSPAATSPALAATLSALRWTAMSDDCQEANARLLSLKTLHLQDRQLTDLRPLAGLSGLETLDLSQNPLVDIAPLAALESLRTLDLRGTLVQDLQPLAPLLAGGLHILQ